MYLHSAEIRYQIVCQRLNKFERAMISKKIHPTDELKYEYLELVKISLDLQRKGDMKAYLLNALRAEQIAQKFCVAKRK